MSHVAAPFGTQFLPTLSKKHPLICAQESDPVASEHVMPTLDVHACVFNQKHFFDLLHLDFENSRQTALAAAALAAAALAAAASLAALFLNFAADADATMAATAVRSTNLRILFRDLKMCEMENVSKCVKMCCENVVRIGCTEIAVIKRGRVLEN